MSVDVSKFRELANECQLTGVTLVAVSKTQAVADIQNLYELGQRDFGENYVQELVDKQDALPENIRWHFIGHLQSNKVKYIAPFVHLIHGVDSEKLLAGINKQAGKLNKVVHCLLQVHIAREETKFGLDEQELDHLIQILHQKNSTYNNVIIEGLMGMASFTNDKETVRSEMRHLKTLFDRYKAISTANCKFSILSMGMSGDYKLAIQEGSNMVRVGSLLFGARPAK